MLLFCGGFFFDFNYPTPWRGWDSKYKLNPFAFHYLWPVGRGFLRPVGRGFLCHFLCRKKVTKETA